jgi:hypothetical protein
MSGENLPWAFGQSENGWVAVMSPTSVNSLSDDGAVITLQKVTTSTSDPRLGGYNLAVLPRDNASADP